AVHFGKSKSINMISFGQMNFLTTKRGTRTRAHRRYSKIEIDIILPVIRVLEHEPFRTSLIFSLLHRFCF
ncbi:MAG: hypothetical protein WB706_05375, partial [Nitrososphaeraceae archaeon]